MSRRSTKCTNKHTTLSLSFSYILCYSLNIVVLIQTKQLVAMTESLTMRLNVTDVLGSIGPHHVLLNNDLMGLGAEVRRPLARLFINLNHTDVVLLPTDRRRES